jgi:hypothetical protein
MKSLFDSSIIAESIGSSQKPNFNVGNSTIHIGFLQGFEFPRLCCFSNDIIREVYMILRRGKRFGSKITIGRNNRLWQREWTACRVISIEMVSLQSDQLWNGHSRKTQKVETGKSEIFQDSFRYEILSVGFWNMEVLSDLTKFRGNVRSVVPENSPFL